MTINYNNLHAHLYITVDRSLYLSLSNGSSGDKCKKAAKYKVHMTRASPDDVLQHLAHVIIQTKQVSIH